MSTTVKRCTAHWWGICLSWLQWNFTLVLGAKHSKCFVLFCFLLKKNGLSFTARESKAQEGDWRCFAQKASQLGAGWGLLTFWTSAFLSSWTLCLSASCRRSSRNLQAKWPSHCSTFPLISGEILSLLTTSLLVVSGEEASCQQSTECPEGRQGTGNSCAVDKF